VSALGFFTRRRVLAFLASACGGVASWASARSDTASLHSRLVALFTDPGSARTIGLAYLRTVGEAEASPERLVQAISGASEAVMASSELKRVIGARIRSDFAEGAIVTVDGWMLSRTEARLCALAALA
jgi:hypothetical protein